ncbi:MAG: hypothetical protein LC721_10830 [Actinobacteria bacterium]|nr:hypothetical protein [Actinomycetota bacterium]
MTQQGAGKSQTPYPREPGLGGGEQDPGGDRDLPPYEDRQKEGPGTDKDALLAERGGVPGHEAGPRDVSDAERGGMTDTDMAPKGPMNVGASPSTSGEDYGRQMSEAGHTKDRMDGGIADSTTNVDPESPQMSTGDQGG